MAAGPWTPALVDPSGAWRPIVALWGVVAEVRLGAPPRHSLEEAGIDELVGRGDPPPLFSLVTTGAVSALGSTFLPERPDPTAIAPLLRERGARFVPALAGTALGPVRACARPLAADGLPLLGRAPGRDDVFVAAGHGPWGVSLGPASARLVAELVLERVTVRPRCSIRAGFHGPTGVHGVTPRLPEGEPAPRDGALPGTGPATLDGPPARLRTRARAGESAAAAPLADGWLLDPAALQRGRARLTLARRLIAERIACDLLA